ncbi:hypothetical protein [Psychrobacter sp. bablab_jr012]|uniref:hypothetical protein n=1 Tax=Psychrobacter sp. bablab_jr012 TaxID=2755061 RepID=UPI0018F6167B|nr:hypothetical protein [Psychrobacter sp. bablab_jr012]
MSFLKNLGKDLGKSAGAVLGGSVKKVGQFVDSDFVQEIGDSVEGSMKNTGNLLGNVADGIAEVGIGIVENDNVRRDKGFSDLGDTTKEVGDQLLIAAGQILENTVNTADGLLERDWDKVKTSGRSLVKVAAVSTIAIGIVEVVDGVDTSGAESLAAADSSTVADSTQIENYNVHDVSPHERVLPNGDVIWVDGDGDTSVDRDTGWTQTNPNYRA